ncbi:hypothetical protein ZOD2009_08439 [Haladaptatus paucihalophilus DX253]|uniref:Cell surface glycoprotein related protein n=1 Tax=Haladaptatus paucihalophilus DX253 TaxID=797209 RepID=E7QSB5_HALPU|nr:hypothetical protein [Haladaptatus paucihalophilus]EFW92884.1 hypothetical protein ZOD2009_08439 [Haladaptatus paucihalophilus DX253]SHK09913.1 hypothetical protein SAMN05444342_0568 [Haladaptatus paucihalophilus DX253]
MTKRTRNDIKRRTRDGIDRRTYLLAVAGGVGAIGGVSAASLGGENDGSRSKAVVRPSEFVLEQDDTCVPLGVVTSDLPIETFYDYRSSDTDPEGWYSAYGPATDLEQAENSVLYLYHGPKGRSLVFMHGKRGSDGGGSVTFHITGLPADGEWAVTDDQYDASTNYDTFSKSDDGWTVDWTWAGDSHHGGGADGGAFRGITRDDVVTIDPAFNDDARLYRQHVNRNYVGPVENWNALAADSDGHRWASLDMETPVVIRSGQCGGNDGSATTTSTTTATEPRTTRGGSRTEETTSATGRTTTGSGGDPTVTDGTTPLTSTATEGAASGPEDGTTSNGQAGFGILAGVAGFLGIFGASRYFERDSSD